MMPFTHEGETCGTSHYRRAEYDTFATKYRFHYFHQNVLFLLFNKRRTQIGEL